MSALCEQLGNDRDELATFDISSLGSDWPKRRVIGDVAGSGLVARLGGSFFRWR